MMNISYKQIVYYSMLFTLSIPAITQGKTCPGNNMPNTVKGLYIKFRITDELEIKSQKSTGAPAYVRGDELAELIAWRNYRWERLFGRYWSDDEVSYKKFMDNFTRKMDAILKQQLQGKDVPMAVIDALTIKFLNFRPKSMAFEYDRIDVETPRYSLSYNKTNKVGYGYFSLNLANINKKQLDPKIRSKTDAFIKSSFGKTNQIFGFKKISTRQSKILGIPCKYEVMKTSFSDAERSYDKIETCKATISGIDVDLYSKMGLPGERYITEAVDVQQAYTINKNVFCSPSYVTVE